MRVSGSLSPVRSEPESGHRQSSDDQCWQTPGLGRTHEQSLSLSAESSQDEEQNTNKEQVGSKFCKLEQRGIIH